MGLKTFDPERPYGLINGDAAEGRYFQDGTFYGADGQPLNPELAMTDDVVDEPPPERRKKS